MFDFWGMGEMIIDFGFSQLGKKTAYPMANKI